MTINWFRQFAHSFLLSEDINDDKTGGVLIPLYGLDDLEDQRAADDKDEESQNPRAYWVIFVLRFLKHKSTYSNYICVLTYKNK